MMVRSPLLIFTLLPLSVHCFAAFSQNTPQHAQSSARVSLISSPLAVTETLDRRQRHTTALSSSNDEEIAALEEKLRQLKENGGAVSAQSTAEVESPSADKPEMAKEPFEEKRFKISDDSTNVMVTGEEPSRSVQEPYEELLSEQWKSRENKGGIDLSDILVKGASAVAILIGLVAFSQVPIGQEDLDKYSTAKPSMSIDLGDLNPVGEDQQSSY